MPIKITAQLANGFVSNDPAIPLDGILMKRALEVEYRTLDLASFLPDPMEKLVYPSNMPLKIRNEGAKWYYACSFALYQPLAEDTQYWHKRFDDHHADYVDFGKRVAKVDMGSGSMRGYRMPMNVIVTPEITWYAVGDWANVYGLLYDVDYIGKKGSQGNGKVIKWTVEQIKEDWSEVKGGKRIRATPCPDTAEQLNLTAGVHLKFRSYRPPYWHRDNFAFCYDSEIEYGT